MNEVLKRIQSAWRSLASSLEARASEDARLAEYIERRRRDILRRAAARIGSY
jgi:hypothetical protein